MQIQPVQESAEIDPVKHNAPAGTEASAKQDDRCDNTLTRSHDGYPAAVCPNCVCRGCDAMTVAKVDRAVRTYKRKLDGKEPFTDFSAMVPASALRAAA